MDSKKAITTALQAKGCTVLRMGDSPSLGSMALVGKDGRDVLAILFDGQIGRSESQQRFCDRWRGVPPVNLYTIQDAEELAAYIEGGEFDRRKIQGTMHGTVFVQPGRRRDF